MVDVTKQAAPAPQPSPPAANPARVNPAMKPTPVPPEEKRAQEVEIEEARLAEADAKQKIMDDAKMGKIQSLEGARPDHEPPIGTKPVNPIPSGLVVGGPVLDLEDQARLARQGKGPEQAPGTKPV